MTSTNITADAIRPGDVILPPKREVSLWMRRHAAERGLPESALYLTVVSVRAGAPDRSGAWLVITTTHSAEWVAGQAYAERPFTFKARPATPWALIGRAPTEGATL